jgi:hypothetical protein
MFLNKQRAESYKRSYDRASQIRGVSARAVESTLYYRYKHYKLTAWRLSTKTCRGNKLTCIRAPAMNVQFSILCKTFPTDSHLYKFHIFFRVCHSVVFMLIGCRFSFSSAWLGYAYDSSAVTRICFGIPRFARTIRGSMAINIAMSGLLSARDHSPACRV